MDWSWLLISVALVLDVIALLGVVVLIALIWKWRL